MSVHGHALGPQELAQSRGGTPIRLAARTAAGPAARRLAVAPSAAVRPRLSAASSGCGVVVPAARRPSAGGVRPSAVAAPAPAAAPAPYGRSVIGRDVRRRRLEDDGVLQLALVLLQVVLGPGSDDDHVAVDLALGARASSPAQRRRSGPAVVRLDQLHAVAVPRSQPTGISHGSSRTFSSP